MKIIKADYEIMDELNGSEIIKKIERCGRVCYKSEEKINTNSAINFIKNIIKNGHESVLEHVSFTVKFIVDRGISHELVRHRIASFSQESTRYCNYGNNNELTFIQPLFWKKNSLEYRVWLAACQRAESVYLKMLGLEATPQEARSILPNSLKTEVIMTANLREWRHFFKLRTSKTAHPQMREVVIPLLYEIQHIIPLVFDDIMTCKSELIIEATEQLMTFYPSEGLYNSRCGLWDIGLKNGDIPKGLYLKAQDYYGTLWHDCNTSLGLISKELYNDNQDYNHNLWPYKPD